MKDLGSPIEVTRVARIYQVDGWWQLKVYNEGLPEIWPEYEAKVLKLALDHGLPVQKVREVVDYENRKAIILEKPKGENLLRLAARRPWKVGEAAKRLAEFQVKIHAIEPDPKEFPGQLEWGQNLLKIAPNLTDRLKEKIGYILDCLPEGNSFCHGAYHPGNVFVDEKKEEGTVVDWIAAYRGPGVSDLARTSVILEAANPPVEFGFAKVLEEARKKFLEAYIEEYFKMNPGGEDVFEGWRAFQATTILPYAQPEEKPILQGIIERGVKDFKAYLKSKQDIPPPPPESEAGKVSPTSN